MMARQERTLTARGVAALSKPGRHADGGGLYLEISARDGASRRSWLYLFSWQGRLKAMGLGAYPAVSLAEAREARDKWRKVVASGENPIAVRRADAAASTAPTFGECALAFLEAKSSQWANAKHRAQWRMTLEVYAAPLWPVPVDKVDTAAILGVLKPVWQTKPEMASRLRGRIETILNAAKARGLRSGENPAQWRGHLDHLLPVRPKLARGHHAAMDYRDVSDFVTQLRAREAVAARALEFLILTASRTNEVLGAQWSEIDLDAKVWTVPAERMKAGREHRVPLPSRAVMLLA